MEIIKKQQAGSKTIMNSLRQKLRLVAILLCLILYVFGGNSCARKPSDPLFYRNSTFKAKITAVGFGTDFRAVVTADPPLSEGGGRFVFEFLSPESLKGVEIELYGGRTRVSMGGVTFADTLLPKNKSRGLPSIAEMLSPTEPVLSIKSVRGTECGLPHREALTAVTTASAVIYIDPESALPLKATANNGAYLLIDILRDEN